MSAGRQHDVVIIGGGIAGAALAYFLAERGVTDVVLLEREAQPGMHATGRSAAVLVEWDPVPTLQALKMASAAFLRTPPPGFAEHPILDPTGILVVAQEPLWSAFHAVAPLLAEGGARVESLSRDEVVARIPALDPAYFDGGVLLPDDGHLDVHGLLWAYLRDAGRHGLERRCDVEVTGIRVEGGRCRGVMTAAGEFGARWVVNAAGAWAGHVGTLAGAAPISLVPHRRTIVAFAAPEDLDVRRWPLVANETHRLYFAPESGGLFVSPMDETPMAPCDARPDETTVAEALARLAKLAPRLAPRTVRRTWAGLRTFTPDRVPVVGEDPRVSGFFWLAGQGGCGIETSPTVGRIAADLIVDGRSGHAVAPALAPGRFGG